MKMANFSKASIEKLREEVDLIHLVGSYLELKRFGSSFKALCPFHDEKTPSLSVNPQYYYCFGCRAQGDAISFLMNYLHVTFVEAIEILVEKFGLVMEMCTKSDDRSKLKSLLREATDFYHFHLLHTIEGHYAIEYLYQRGMTLAFIKRFHLGFAPRSYELQKKVFSKFSKKDLISSGLFNKFMQPFFCRRITIPILDNSDNVIGFSSRSLSGLPKYINTNDTPIFNKSKVLFGLNYSRTSIAKKKEVILVEGQFDALFLIDSGYDNVVAAQGTAFVSNQLNLLLRLGINKAYIAFDGDSAGRRSAINVGQLFQKNGIEALHLPFCDGDDPDIFLKRCGVEAFKKLLDQSIDHLTFAYNILSKDFDISSPAGKNKLASILVDVVKKWDHEVMIHEGIRKLSYLLRVPEDILYESPVVSHTPKISVDGDLILESDLIRWIILRGDTTLIKKLSNYISEKDFKHFVCRGLYVNITTLLRDKKYLDRLQLFELLSEEEEKLFSNIVKKKVNMDKFDECFKATIEKILERRAKDKKEEIRKMIDDANDEDLEFLTKEFDRITKEDIRVEI